MAAGTLTTFGSYTFPTKQVLVMDNFTNVVPRTVRLPGVSGGYSEFQDESPPREIGNVSVTCWIEESTASAFQTALDNVRALAVAGKQLLTLEPINTALADRWCYAVVQNINVPFNASDAPGQYKQRVTINFQIEDPVWWTNGPTPPTITVIGVGTTNGTITNDGLVTTLPVISLSTGGSVVGGTIQRLVSGTVIDQLSTINTTYSYFTTVWDCPSANYTRGGTPGYAGTASVSFNHPAWIQLLPGDNVIRVITGTTSSGTATFSFDYDEGYI